MKKKIFLLIVSIFLIAGCAKNEKKQTFETTTDTEIEFTVTDEKILKNGYLVGDTYTYYLMDGQKKDEQIAKDLLGEVGVSLESNFKKFEYKIDTKKKVNIVPFLFSYDLSNEILTINYFIVNTQDTEINEISFLGRPEFPNIEAGPLSKINFNKTEFGTLPPNGFVIFSTQSETPIELEPYLKENKTEDIKFVFKDLKINGEAVENVNEN